MKTKKAKTLSGTYTGKEIYSILEKAINNREIKWIPLPISGTIRNKIAQSAESSESNLDVIFIFCCDGESYPYTFMIKKESKIKYRLNLSY
jgi:hypothetical protein